MAGLRRTTAQRSTVPDWPSGGLDDGDSASLREVEFGGNPGELRMLVYLPPALPAGSPLVVALHGSGMTAADYAEAAGWRSLADRHGFALLLPEQRRSNHPDGSFHWFLASDARRNRGEASSIRSMIASVLEAEQLDASRIYVAGFGAGGAMASALLATYPDVFAAGAILAGVAFGGVSNADQALEMMAIGRSRPSLEWAYFVRRASRHKDRWPRISVWHGSADPIVAPANAGEIIKQWTEVHGLPLYPSEAGVRDGHPYRVWLGPDRTKLLEFCAVEGMAHAIPVAAAGGDGAGGLRGRHTADLGVPSSLRIAEFWGIAQSPNRSARR